MLIFVMGADTWRSEPDWPLPNTAYTDYFLHSDGSANTRRGDGTLSTTPPQVEPSDTLVYDPHQPVPTVGGQVLIPGANSVGPRDQRAVEDRDDVLVYSTPALTEPIEVTGPIRLRLFITSTAPDTDLTGKLVDVFPDGRAINLTDGIQRVRYRNSKQQAELITPGEIYEVTVDLWATPTSSSLAIGSALKSPAATGLALVATPTPAAPSPTNHPRRTSLLPTASCTTPITRRDSCCRSSGMTTTTRPDRLSGLVRTRLEPGRQRTPTALATVDNKSPDDTDP